MPTFIRMGYINILEKLINYVKLSGIFLGVKMSVHECIVFYFLNGHRIIMLVSANQLSLVNKVAAKNKFNDIMG